MSDSPQLDRALAAIDEANADDDAQRPRATWTCPQCAERVEDQFAQCWKCGHMRPAGAGDVVA